MKPFFRSIAGQTFLFLLAGIIGSALLTMLAGHLVSGNPHVVFIFAACVFGLAYAVARIFTRPLRELAAAATRLGGDINSDPLPEAGPTEVREAAIAFNGMQERIRRDVLERSSMLAAITHDLQTPLTRLRLRLEKVHDEELRAQLLGDLAAMRETVSEGLDLAQSLDAREPVQRVDLDSLLSSICEDAREIGKEITFNGSANASVLCAPNALRRCITNLVDNATTYGQVACVESSADGKHAIVNIRDDGPGIPEKYLARVFDPFFRLESSRSRETGGTGLGLTIARNIARRFGGEITLENHAQGGLVVRLALPIARVEGQR